MGVLLIDLNHSDNAMEYTKTPDQVSWLLNFLMKVDMFSALTPEELYEVIRHVKKMDFRKGEAIVEQGAVGDSFFIISKGTAKPVLKKGPETVELGVLGPEQFFGEMALILDQPRSATVMAAEDVECFVLLKTDFQFLVRKNPVFAHVVHAASDARAIDLSRKSS